MANDPFGTFGNLNSYIGTTKPDLSKLPPWLQAQLQDEVRVDEGGNQTHNYSFNQNPWGGFKGEDGQYYVQVGGPNGNGASDGGVKDPSKIIYRPDAGYVTTPDNLNDTGIGGVDWRMVAAVVGAGLLGGAAGLGADGLSSAGAVAGTDAAESGGTLALNAAGNGVSPYAGSSGLLGGAGGNGASGLLGGAEGGTGLSPLEGVTLGPDPSAGIGTMGQYAGTPWYQSALSGAMANPMGLARTGLGLYSMLSAAHGNSGGGDPSGGLLGGSVAGGPIPQFDPMKSMGQFQQNPYLLAQMNSIPFMGGSYGR